MKQGWSPLICDAVIQALWHLIIILSSHQNFTFNVLCFFFSLPENRTVHYCLTNNKHFTFPASTLPEQLRSQKQIVELMANYMEQNLMEVRGSVLIVKSAFTTLLYFH